jgi:RNA polymerase sigma-70 factor (ECF subfamily)
MRLTVAPELIDAARSGDRDGMERLLAALWPHAYRIARSITQNAAAAEDAAQEACAIVYREIASLRSADAFRAWCYRIVAREAMRAAKHNATAAVAALQLRSDVDERLDVLRALGALAPRLRAVVVLHYYADLNSGEIGRALGIPAPTVRYHLATARKQLARLLASGEVSLPALPEVCHE